MRRHKRGFTIIELMITLAVLAILVAIAYPTYTRYVAKSNRSAAESYLMDLAQREQQYLLDSRSYADDTTIKGLDAVPVNVSPQYTITVTPNNAATPPTFMITAVPVAGSMQAQLGEPTLSIDYTGAKLPTNLWQ